MDDIGIVEDVVIDENNPLTQETPQEITQKERDELEKESE